MLHYLVLSTILLTSLAAAAPVASPISNTIAPELAGRHISDANTGATWSATSESRPILVDSSNVESDNRSFVSPTKDGCVPLQYLLGGY